MALTRSFTAEASSRSRTKVGRTWRGLGLSMPQPSRACCDAMEGADLAALLWSQATYSTEAGREKKWQRLHQRLSQPPSQEAAACQASQRPGSWLLPKVRQSLFSFFFGSEPNFLLGGANSRGGRAALHSDLMRSRRGV